MNFKVVVSWGSGISILFGLAFLLAPLSSLAIYGYQGADPAAIVMARFFGSAYLVFGCFAWGVRGVENNEIQRAAAKPTAIAALVGAGVSLLAVLSGTFNVIGWSAVAIHLIFAALWARVGYMR
ncbi:MAG: hypothetical protein NVS3B3_07190 [Aquirhabdus sp.]